MSERERESERVRGRRKPEVRQRHVKRNIDRQTKRSRGERER